MAISFGSTSKDVYAKIWKIEYGEKFVKAQISTSRKDKKTNEYINSPWHATFVGNCVDSAKQLNEGDKIQISSAQIENAKGKDGKYYVNMIIFGFSADDGGNNQQSSPRPVNSKRTQNLDVPPAYDDSDMEDSLPF